MFVILECKFFCYWYETVQPTYVKSSLVLISCCRLQFCALLVLFLQKPLKAMILVCCSEIFKPNVCTVWCTACNPLCRLSSEFAMITWSSSSGSTVLYGPWPPWWFSPRYFYHMLSSTMSLLSITLHILRHYQATLILVFPFSDSLQAARLSFCKVSFPTFWLNVLVILTWLPLLLWLYLDLYINRIVHHCI
jgi:hypothetical protein